jgi:hypothetical protein
MTIIPVSLLLPTDLARLGNNLLPTARHDRTQQLDPVRRSLTCIGEIDVAIDGECDDTSVHEPAIHE